MSRARVGNQPKRVYVKRCGTST